MTNRRMDAIYFVLLLAVFLIAYLASSRSSDSSALLSPDDLRIPDLHANLEPPPVELPEPFFAFRRASSYTSPGLSRPIHGDEMESVLAEVRIALLESSVPGEVVQSR